MGSTYVGVLNLLIIIGLNQWGRLNLPKMSTPHITPTTGHVFYGSTEPNDSISFSYLQVTLTPRDLLHVEVAQGTPLPPSPPGPEMQKEAPQSPPKTRASPKPLASNPPVCTLWNVLHAPGGTATSGLQRPASAELDAESIAESVYHQPPKAADRSAANRLAKRLYTLDGFKITDVSKHLCKR